MSAHVDRLVDRLRDARGRKVVFVSHCVLNENVRYLGGACRAGCIPEIVAQCVDRGIGLVQMPCPEQRVWGGVRKRWLLALCGDRRFDGWTARTILIPLFLAFTRAAYRRLARAAARQIADYRRSGHAVIAVVGIDGSPSCGVATTLDAPRAVARLARVDLGRFTVAEMNRIVRDEVVAGSGMFVAALRRELARRGLAVPFVAHDLIAELDGRPAALRLGV
jgi:predicted secreted protein